MKIGFIKQKNVFCAMGLFLFQGNDYLEHFLPSRAPAVSFVLKSTGYFLGIKITELVIAFW